MEQEHPPGLDESPGFEPVEIDPAGETAVRRRIKSNLVCSCREGPVGKRCHLPPEDVEDPKAGLHLLREGEGDDCGRIERVRVILLQREVDRETSGRLIS